MIAFFRTYCLQDSENFTLTLLSQSELDGNNMNVTSMDPNGWWDTHMYNEQCGWSSGEWQNSAAAVRLQCFTDAFFRRAK